MSVVPRSNVDKIAFYEAHNTPWAANAVAIGTTTTAVTSLATLTTAARTALNAQVSAQNAAKAATLAVKTAVDAMALAGSEIILQIRSKATASGDSVYTLAQIPAPALPSPVGPPGTPSNFKVALNADGTLKLSWKCVNPPGAIGTIYQVYRRIGATGTFSYLGATGTKDIVDNSLPAGSSSVTYQIQAARSTSVGEWAQFNVNFGVGGGSGFAVTSVTEGPPGATVKIAA